MGLQTSRILTSEYNLGYLDNRQFNLHDSNIKGINLKFKKYSYTTGYVVIFITRQSAASDGCFSCSQYVKVAITSSIFVMEILGQNHAFYSNWHLEQQSELPAQAAHGLPRHHQGRWNEIFLGKTM